MATVKVASLVIRTLAKPISAQLKLQAQEHDSFRRLCINVAQSMHRYEMRMRTNLLGETTGSGQKPHIRALSETKAIATGANFISEAFLFSVAVALIFGESYRSNRKEGKRRDMVADRLDSLEEAVKSIQDQQRELMENLQSHTQQSENVLQVLGGVIDVEMRNSEMRRILTKDPDIVKALQKLEEDQKQAGISEERRTSKLLQELALSKSTSNNVNVGQRAVSSSNDA